MAKNIIHRKGDEITTLSYVLEGSAVVYTTDENDEHEVILAYINKGDFIGEMGVFDPSKLLRESTIKAKTNCVLAQISYDRFNHMMKSEFKHGAYDMFQLLGRQLTRRLSSTSRRINDLAFLDIEGRMVKAIIELSKSPDAITHPNGILIKITRQELSNIIACSREMAGQSLKSLEKKGFVAVSGKSIVVLGGRSLYTTKNLTD